MSYEPSHRKPPRQERWPQATPAEGWPSYREGDPFQAGDHAAREGAYQPAEGYPDQAGYRQAPGGPGYRSAVAMAPFPPAGNGYGSGSGTGYAEAQDGYDWNGDGHGGTGPGYGGDSSYGSGGAGHGYGGDGRYGTADGYGTGTGNGYGGSGYGAAGNGSGDGSSYRTGGYPGDGYAGGIDGYAGGINGYAGGTDGYAGGADGYVTASDGFDGAPDGYQRNEVGYGTATRERPGDANGHDWNANGHDWNGNGHDWNGNGHDWNEDGYAGTADGFAQSEDGFAGSPDDFAGPGGYQGAAGSAEPGMFDPMLAAPDAHVHPDTWQADQEQRRQAGRRGLIVGAVTGFLAVAVGISVSTLAAAFVGPQASPAAAIGGVFIDRTPAPLRSFAAQHFGAHGHAVLLLGMYVAIAVLAVGVGVLTRHAAALGVAGLAAFTLFAAFVTITRPQSRVSDVAPSVVGGLAAAAALLWLVRASAPAAPTRHARGGVRRRAR